MDFMRRTCSSWVLPGMAALLATVLYLNTLSAGFAYDDSRAIQKNPDLRPETPLMNLALDDFWGTPLTHSGSHKSYRPLCVLTFRLNYLLGGLDPWGYHLGNVLCHALTTAVFTALAQWLLAGDENRNGKSRAHGGVMFSYPSSSSDSSNSNFSWILGFLESRNIGAATAGLLFAAHPIHTEAVAGVVGRADVLSCLFFLLTFLNYARYVSVRHSSAPARRVVPAALVGALAVAALLNKEHAITVLAVCAVYDVLVVHKVTPKDIFMLGVLTKPKYRGALEGLALLFCYGSLLLGFRIYFQGNKPPEFAPSDNPASDSDSLLTRMLTFNFLPAANVWLLLCPYLLSFDWSMEAIPLVESIADVRNVATLTFYASLGYAVVWIVQSIERESERSFNSQSNGHGAYSAHNGSNGHSVSALSSSPSHKAGVNGSLNGSSYISKPNSVFSTPLNHHHQNGKNGCHNGGGYLLIHADAEGERAPQTFQPVDVVVLSLAIIVFPYIPASNMFFYVGFVLAERVLYTPSMGLCLLVGAGVQALCNTHPARRKWVLAAFSLVLAAFSARTVLRNLDWQTEEKLYTSGLKVNPAKAWGNLANIYNDQSDHVKAEEAYKNALQYRSNMADVHYNLGILLQNQNRHDEAVESYKKAIHFRPRLSVAHLNLGILTAQLGDIEQAKKIYDHCAVLDTSGLKDPRLHDGTKISCLFNHGRLLMDSGNLEGALEKLNEALERRPDHYAPQSIYNMMGETYFKLNRLEDAEHWYQQALKVKPDHIPAHLTMAKLMIARNDHAKAEEWLDKAKEIESDNIAVDNHKASLLSSTGRHKEAMALLDAALPNLKEDFDAVYNAASIYREGGNKEKAEELYVAATKLKPKEAAAWMNLGAMLHINSKYEQAEQAYLTALKLRPGDQVTLDNLQRLHNLTKRKG